MKICLYCGKEYKGRNKCFCSMKCAGLYRQNYKTCAICGKVFKSSPTEMVHTCGDKMCVSRYKALYYRDTSTHNLKKAQEEKHNNPYSGSFDTNMLSKTWVIESPEGKRYNVSNLLNWCKQNEGIVFSDSYMTFYRGIQNIKQTIQGKKVRGSYQYKGWHLITFYEENLNYEKYINERTEGTMSKLKEIRTSRGLSQSQLATKSGVALKTIQKYESGERDINKAQGYTLYLLANILDCKMEDFIEKD